MRAKEAEFRGHYKFLAQLACKNPVREDYTEIWLGARESAFSEGI